MNKQKKTKYEVKII
ncbi:Protein of unknown function [Bacillus wiedmannii]|nr:Protein of unknown function [Bacillus wiedmannii]